MTFTAPFGLLALVSLPAIVALHLFRDRLPQQAVAAMFLFPVASVRSDGGRTRTRLWQSPSLWLECLAALLVTLWLAGFTFAELRPRHLVVVVDDSASMAAVGTATQARAALRELHEGLGREDLVTVVRSGEPPQVVVGPHGRAQQLLTFLDAWSPTRPSHRLRLALDLGLELAGRAGELVLLTDGEAPEAGEDLRVIGCGVASGNAALTRVARTVRRGRDVLEVTVRSYGTTNGGDLVVYDGERRLLSMPLLPSTNGNDVRFDVPLVGAGERLRVVLPEDALAIDNVAWSVPTTARQVSVCDQLSTTAREQLQLDRALQVLRDWRREPDPTRAQVVLRSDALASSPTGLQPGQLEVVFAASGKRRGHRSPFVIDRSHELLQGVALEGVAWQSGSGDLPGRVLVASGDKVLVSEQWLSVGRRLWLDLDGSAGNVVRAPDWPILLANVLAAGRREAPGCASTQVLVGEELRYRGERSTSVSLIGPRGAVLATGVGSLSQVVMQPGLHRLRADDGSELAAVAVQFRDARESDLRDAHRVDRAASRAVRTQVEARVDAGPMRRWLGLLLLLVVLGNWWWLHRGRA